MAIDNKYGKVEIPGVPEDEPVFILRAQDKLALPTIARYRNHGAMIEDPEQQRSQEWFDSLDVAAEAFREWQVEHPAKLPD